MMNCYPASMTANMAGIDNRHYIYSYHYVHVYNLATEDISYLEK